mgnify:CR=1 FL=1|tara:strand:+ start:2839 stop:3033 length:195 start_codon:yes stop_codon:yes gene_type:complete
MKTVRILIDTQNATFEDAPGQEVARILKGISENLIRETIPKEEGQKLFDINGNVVGYVSISEEL